MSNVQRLSDCFTQEMPTCSLLLLSLGCRTHKRTIRTPSQSEVSLKHHYNGNGSHNKICSKLAQITLRKGHNYADSLAHSQAGPQAYRCLGWRDREVVVGVAVKVGVEVKVGDHFWSESRRRYNTIRSGTNMKIISHVGQLTS